MITVGLTTISADDGRPLYGTWVRPEVPPIGVVVIAPAMATPSTFYRPFAETLAEAGHAVLTFDYRGMEVDGDIRTVRADLRTWANDAASALEAAAGEVARWGGSLPLTWVGHSFGGQILGFVDHSLLSRVIVVATGHGYWRNNPIQLRRWVLFFWNVLVPVSTAIKGYYPGKSLRFLTDLPKDAMLQWRRWCLDPGYWQADVPDILARHAELRVPVTAIHLTDDQMVVRRGVQSMLDQFTSASTELVELQPRDLRSPAVGHHGFFRAQHVLAWKELVLPRLAATLAGDAHGYTAA